MIEALKAVSTTGMTDAQLEAHAAKLSAAESDYFLALRDAKQTYVDQMKTSDATVESSIKQMERIIDDNAGLYSGFSSVDISTGKNIFESNKTISNESKRVKASDEYVKAHVGVKTGEK